MQRLAPLYSVGWHNQTRPGANEKEFRINAALDSQEAGGSHGLFRTKAPVW